MASRFYFTLTIVFMSVTLVHCAKRTAKREIFQTGLGYCSSTKLGDFDVSLIRSVKEPGYFELTVTAINVLEIGGEYIRVAIANKQLDYEELVPAELLKPNKVLYEGFITPAQLQLYNLVVIAPYKGGNTTLLNTSADGSEAICEIPTTDVTSTTQPTSL